MNFLISHILQFFTPPSNDDFCTCKTNWRKNVYFEIKKFLTYCVLSVILKMTILSQEGALWWFLLLWISLDILGYIKSYKPMLTEYEFNLLEQVGKRQLSQKEIKLLHSLGLINIKEIKKSIEDIKRV